MTEVTEDVVALPIGRADDVLEVRLTAELLLGGIADVRWLLHEALLSGARCIVVDLSGVERLSSPVVASMLCAHRVCRARGGALLLRHADRRTEELLRRTGLWRVLRPEQGREPGERPTRRRTTTRWPGTARAVSSADRDRLP